MLVVQLRDVAYWLLCSVAELRIRSVLLLGRYIPSPWNPYSYVVEPAFLSIPVPASDTMPARQRFLHLLRSVQ